MSDPQEQAVIDPARMSLSELQRRYRLGTSNAMRLQDDLRAALRQSSAPPPHAQETELITLSRKQLEEANLPDAPGGRSEEVEQAKRDLIAVVDPIRGIPAQRVLMQIDALIEAVSAAHRAEVERLKAEINFQKTRANENAVRATEAEERADRLQIVRDDCVRAEAEHLSRITQLEAEVARLTQERDRLALDAARWRDSQTVLSLLSIVREYVGNFREHTNLCTGDDEGAPCDCPHANPTELLDEAVELIQQAFAAHRPPALTFEHFSAVNRERCESPNGFNHALTSWSLSDWFLAVLGELGESANVGKKLNRVRDGIPGNKESPEALRAKLRKEVGDTFVYLDLLAQSQGFTVADAAVEVFNAKSDEIGCSIKIDVDQQSAPHRSQEPRRRT